jgi:hypothetical protein
MTPGRYRTTNHATQTRRKRSSSDVELKAPPGAGS